MTERAVAERAVTERAVDERAVDESTVVDHPKGDFDLSRAVWQRADGDAAEGIVEIAFVDDLIGMRSSAAPDGPVLVFTQDEWDAFVGGVQDGEFDLA